MKTVKKLMTIAMGGAMALSGVVFAGNIATTTQDKATASDVNVTQEANISSAPNASTGANDVSLERTAAKKIKTTWLYNSSKVYYSNKLIVGQPTTVRIQAINYGRNRTAYLQRWNSSKKKYLNVSKVKLSWYMKSGSYGQGNIKYKASAGSSSYRIYLPATSKYTSLTYNFKVSISDPRKYTGYRKTAYNYAKKYCPVMNLTTKSKLPGGAIGLYTETYNIQLKTGLKGTQLKETIIHECGHLKTTLVYGGLYNAIKPSNKLFHTSGWMGTEKLADCMAQVKTGTARYSYYTGGRKCSSSQLAAAKRVWAGKKI